MATTRSEIRREAPPEGKQDEANRTDSSEPPRVAMASHDTTLRADYLRSVQYPFADVYPHHVRPDLTRCDGNGLGSGMQVTRYAGFDRPSVQISRRSNNRDPSIETALHKLLKVIDWAMKK